MTRPIAMRISLLQLSILLASVLLLSSCSSNSSLLSNAEKDNDDDVYFTEKSLTEAPDDKWTRADSKGTASAERPDYYNPEVAEQLRYDRLRGRNRAFYPNDRYYDQDPYYDRRYYRPGYGIGSGGTYYYRNNGSNGSKNSYNGSNNSDSSGGGGSDSGSNDGRDRSYDSSDNRRKR